MICNLKGELGLCNSCITGVYVVIERIWAAIKELARRLTEWLKTQPLMHAYEDCLTEPDRNARAWREQHMAALADQLPPPGLAMGRTVTPRARCNLPAGIRFRGVGPNAKAAN